MRYTDTRQRVRQVAQRILEEGGDPTPTVVRKALGGGSPNLIVDELRRWRQERTGSPASTGGEPAGGSESLCAFKAAQDMGMQSLAVSLAHLSDLVAQQTISAQRTLSAEKDITGVAALMRELHTEASGLAQVILAERQSKEEELQKLGQRFEAVQRVMLLSIEEARAETRRWKEEYLKVKEELSTWRTAVQAQNNALSLECASLKGRLEELRRECTSLRAAQAVREGRG